MIENARKMLEGREQESLRVLRICSCTISGIADGAIPQKEGLAASLFVIALVLTNRECARCNEGTTMPTSHGCDLCLRGTCWHQAVLDLPEAKP